MASTSVAVLVQIARDTATALADIRAELRLLRTEMQGLRGDVQEQRMTVRRPCV
jgi:hypothetical protein